MTTYYSTNNLFSYTVTNNSSTYTLDSDDYTIIAAAFNKWDELLDKDPRFSTYTITVSVSVSTLDEGVLGGASLNTVYYFGTMNFGNTFPADGNITLSDSYLPSLKTAIHNDGNSSYYHVFLHELGHILGIGSLWDLTDFPKTAYVEDSQIKYYYTGEKALQEYKNYFPEYDNSNFVGIPFEDDGSSGTMNVHPEEGSEGTTSSDDRYINGIFHPGLDTELMSGWLDSYPTNAPLSRITLGFLDDMGYVVDYSKADTYRGYSANSFNSSNFSNYSSYMSQWLSDSDNANLLLSTQFSNYVDISAGDIVLRNKNDEKLFVSGDISFNKNTTLGLTRDKLISREIDTFSYGGAVNTFGLDSSFNILGINENDNVGKVIATNESMNTIGIGYPMDNGEGTKRGKVKVYQIDTNINLYRQIGQDITGTTDNGQFGHSLDINDDGTILAVGTKDISHNTLVYKYDLGSWGLYGNSIYKNVNTERTFTTTTVTPATGPSLIFACDFTVAKNNGDTITDSVGNTVGTYTEGITSNTTDGLSCDGIGMVEFPFNQYFDMHGIDTNNNYYVELYLYADSISSEDTFLAFGPASSSGNTFWGSGAQTAGQITLRFRNTGGVQIYAMGPNGGYLISYSNSNIVSSGQWVHLIITGNATGMGAYVNGSLAAGYSHSQTNDTKGAATYDAMYIGAHNHSSSNNNYGLHGHIKYVRLYKGANIYDHRATLYDNRENTSYVATFGDEITTTTTTIINQTTFTTIPKLNKEGDKLAVLYNSFYEDLSSNGIVQSYQYSESDASWNYLGDKIESSFLNDISGGTIDMNADGDVIAIGYPNIDETGYVRVYNYDSSWNQIGSDITGSANEQFGKSLSLDLCGNNIAIGAPYAGDVSGGKIQIYTNNSNTWSQVGTDINIQTTASNDISMALLGNSVNLNSAANMLIASHQDTENNTINANVYSYNTTNTSWESKLTKTLDNDVADNEIMPAFMNSSENKFLITNPSHSTASKTDVGRINISTVHKDINYKNSTYELQTGKVGIGIETPSVAFDISGSVHIDNGNVLVTDISAGNSKLHVAGDLTTSVNFTSINTTALLYDNPVDFQNRLFVNSSDIQFTGGDNTRPSDITVVPSYTNLSLTINVRESSVSGYGGRGLSVNYDGSVFVYMYSSYLRVWEYSTPGVSGGTWSQRGQIISVQSYNFNASISDDGNIIATCGYYSGTGEVWLYNGSDTWNQMGQTITAGSGDIANVELSGDGNRIALGCFRVEPNGYVEVWQYSNPGSTTGTWSQIGQTISGPEADSYCGDGLALNYDGSVLAETAPYADSNNGTVRIWLYNGSNAWNQLGGNINGLGLTSSDRIGQGNNTAREASRKLLLNNTGDIVFAVQQASDYCLIYKYSLPGQTGGSWDLIANIQENTVFSETNDAYLTNNEYTITADGLKLFVGHTSLLSTGENGSYYGGFSVYTYDSITNTFNHSSLNLSPYETHFMFPQDRFEVSGDGSVIFACDMSESSYRGRILGVLIENVPDDINVVSQDATFHHSLIVPGNLVIVDGSNNSSFGSYTTYSKENSLTELFHVGKSKSNVFNIVNSNNVGVYMNSGSTTFSSTSDESLKKDIQSLDKFTVDKLTQIESKRFDWKSSKKHDVGFIAQEVEEILPEIIEENTYNDGNTYKGIKTSSLLPLCLDKLKELEDRIDKL